jgi:hypothetical protein
MHKTKSKNKTKKIKHLNQSIEEFELPISLEELAIYIIQEGEPTSEIIKILDNEPDKVNEIVKNILNEVEELTRNEIIIQSVKFDYCDSLNITHGVAYFKVWLKGKKESLRKISKLDWPFTKKDD